MTAFTTPKEIELFELLTLRGALKLEILGMKHSKFNASVILRDKHGIRGRKRTQLAWLEDRIQSLKEDLGHE